MKRATVPTLAELRETARAQMVALVPKLCECGSDRDPRPMIRGPLCLLVCERCGGRTTPRKEA